MTQQEQDIWKARRQLKRFILKEMGWRKTIRSWTDTQRQLKIRECEQALAALDVIAPAPEPEQVQTGLFD
jgi:hypothetical protein